MLGFEGSFFGLIAAGWEIDALSAPGAARQVSRETTLTECVVALFDLERANGKAMPAAEFNGMVAASLAGQKLPAFRPIAEAELERVRALRDEALARWQALPAGGTLELPFPAE